MAADYPDPLPESMAPMPRLRLLARFLLMIYSWFWNGTLRRSALVSLRLQLL
jgi:hypothetical protein